MDTKNEKSLLQNQILLFKKFIPDSRETDIMGINISIHKLTEIREIEKTIATTLPNQIF